MKNSWLKKGMVVALAAIMALTLGACSSDTADSSSNQVELTFWNAWAGNSSDAVPSKKLEEFEKKHPEIKIKTESIPHDQYKIKVKTQAAGKQLPDMIQVWPGAELKPLVDGGVLMPIDDLVGEWKDKLIPANQLKDYQINGKQYAIPGTKSYTHVIYYDKDMLKKVGYDKFPTTYDDFKALIKKLRDSGVTPIALGDKGKWVLQSCYMSEIGDRITGSKFLTEALDGKKKFTDPEFVQALNVIKELKDLKAFNEDFNNLDNVQQRDYFIQGKAAMMIEGTWAFSDLKAKLPKDKKLGIAFFPTISGGKGDPTAVSGVTGVGIALNANLSPEKKKAAYTFLKEFYNEDLYKRLLADGVLVPAKVNLPDNIDPAFNDLVTANRSGKLAPVYDAVLPTELTDIINNGLQAITTGDSTPQQVAESMQKALNK